VPSGFVGLAGLAGFAGFAGFSLGLLGFLDIYIICIYYYLGTAGILQICNIARHSVVIIHVPIYHAFY